MTVQDLGEQLGADTLVAGDNGRCVTGGYCGDLLSWVMGRAQEGDCWITVMGNVNTIAVAVLADVACILLADHSPLDEEARQRAEAQGVPILRSDRNTYELAVALARLLDSET